MTKLDKTHADRAEYNISPLMGVAVTIPTNAPGVCVYVSYARFCGELWPSEAAAHVKEIANALCSHLQFIERVAHSTAKLDPDDGWGWDDQDAAQKLDSLIHEARELISEYPEGAADCMYCQLSIGECDCEETEDDGNVQP